jgi:hypothetical protein
MTLRRVATTLAAALVSCAAVMAFTGAMFGILDRREEGLAAAGPFMAFGSLAFLTAALVCCIPVLSILTATRLLPRPSRSAVIGAFLAMLTAPGIIAVMFGDGRDWIRQLPYLVVKPEMMLPWMLPFAIPGAVLGALWASGTPSRRTNSK